MSSRKREMEQAHVVPGPAGTTTGARPLNPEVEEKAKRRMFSAEYKRRILREADACTKPGEVGALLRREGLYSSHLSSWRKQRERGELAGLWPKKRGRKSRRKTVSVKEYERLSRENRRLRQRLEQAELVIEIQKKASEMLGIPLRSLEGGDSA